MSLLHRISIAGPYFGPYGEHYLVSCHSCPAGPISLQSWQQVVDWLKYHQEPTTQKGTDNG